MSPKEAIMYYIPLYSGQYDSIVKRIKSIPFSESIIDNAFSDLIRDKYIELIPYLEMDQYQKAEFDINGSAYFYRILKPYSE